MTKSGMTSTTITYDERGKQVGVVGPEFCAACSRTLLDRSCDEKRESYHGVSTYTDSVWEHKTDSSGKAICGACAIEQEQLAIWLEILRWQKAGSHREFHLTRDGLSLIDGKTTVSFAAPDGELCGGAIRSFLTAPTVKRFEAMDSALYEVPSVPNYTRAMSDADEECPKTERNTER